MKVRTIAGLGMLLLSAGLLLIYFVGSDGPETVAPESVKPVPGVPRAMQTAPAGPEDVTAFLENYNRTYQQLWSAFEGTSWTASADISEENSASHRAAALDLADFVGGRTTIEQLRLFKGRLDLSPLQDRQVEVAWQLAAHVPGTLGSVVEDLIATRTALVDSVYSHRYTLTLPGQPTREVTPNEIDQLLLETRDPLARQLIWEASKTAGPGLKDGLVKLQGLRNQVARDMGYSSFFALETADYGLSSQEMVRLMDDLVAGIMPLYRQLHCWVRHELAARYGADEVPTLIPAHWLGNRYGQEWPGVVEGVDLDAMFTDVQPRWVIEQAERFYTSLGFSPLPATFWERSDLYALPADSLRKKNTHASAWHIDLDQDVRSLMSVTPNFRWFSTTHHELGHIYYYLAYSRPEVPMVLRRGANRGFHEAVGTLAELASNQVPYLQQIGLLDMGEAPEPIAWLLNQALQGPVVFLPFACGTMSHWEHDLYENELPRHQFNTRWWEYAARYQGLAAPAERGEEYCDPATKTHIIDDPAQYYDYALSAVILHQLHRYICRDILDQDVRAANYYGNLRVGRYLHSILELGATRDWSVVMRQATGDDLSSEALLEYFAPLQEWLEVQNAGRQVGF
jgi:peptidyl-dipeptidase A